MLRPPWGHRATTVASEGPPVVVVGSDAGVTRPKPKKRRPRPAGSPAGVAGGEAEPEEPELAPLTAADRALEWRGDDVTLPAQTLDMARGGEARSLDDGEINATINSQAGGVKDCVVQGATGTDLRATISVKLVVDGRGRVIRSRVQAPRYLFEHGLLACTQRAVGRMRFPATGGATLVTLPVNLG
ncbi:MAG TPA: hypothetical protein VFT22_44805 [Kofleriaceae bacterium]|nr:hypothetical protein [Kofleriaceae bacterium]